MVCKDDLLIVVKLGLSGMIGMQTTFVTEAIMAAEKATLSLRNGAIVYLRGDASDCAYLIKSGCVEVRQKGHAVEKLCAGEIFGEMCLIDGGPRSATVLAASDLELVRIDRARFLTLVRDDEDFAMAIMRLMVRRHRATWSRRHAFVGLILGRNVGQTSPASRP